MGTHLLIDFETMGTNVNEAAVIDCSAIVFNTDKMLSNDPYTMKSLAKVKRFKLSMKDQVANYGWKIEEETLKFWETVSDDAKTKIKMTPTDLTVNQFCEQFIDYLIDNPKIDRWWSRSNTFDPIIIWRIFKAAQKASHLEAHLSYWKVRDIRTFIDAKLNFPAMTSFVPVEDEEFWNKAFVQHDSSWDVLADMLRIQKILRAENDLELIRR